MQMFATFFAWGSPFRCINGEEVSSSRNVMSNSPSENEDHELRMLLQQSRPTLPLPPGFKDAVWRRLQAQEKKSLASNLSNWLDQLAEWALRPRWAIAGLTLFLVTGSFWGTLDGMAIAKQNAQARYLMSVAPTSIR